jgi:hypothetical protein
MGVESNVPLTSFHVDRNSNEQKDCSNCFSDPRDTSTGAVYTGPELPRKGYEYRTCTRASVGPTASARTLRTSIVQQKDRGSGPAASHGATLGGGGRRGGCDSCIAAPPALAV